MALLAGTDLECGSGSWAPGSPDSYLALGDAVKQGLVKEADLDKALRRLFSAQFRLGVYDPAAAAAVGRPHLRDDRQLDEAPGAGARGRAQVDRAAEERRRHPAAEEDPRHAGGDRAERRATPRCWLGNYNGTPVGAGQRAGRHQGRAAEHEGRLRPRRAAGDRPPRPRRVPGSALSSEGKPGLKADYYKGVFEGAPVLTRTDAAIDFDWADGSPDPALDDDSFSVRWTGRLTAPATGWYHARRALRDAVPAAGRQQADRARAARTTSRRPSPAASRCAPAARTRSASSWSTRSTTPSRSCCGRRRTAAATRLAEAVAAAQSADAVVMVLGLSSRLEGEEMPVRIDGFAGGDRISLELPKVQQALLEKVVAAAKGKPVVLVLLNGSALAVELGGPERAGHRRGLVPGPGGRHGGRRRAVRQRQPGRPPAAHLLSLASSNCRPSTTTR